MVTSASHPIKQWLIDAQQLIRFPALAFTLILPLFRRGGCRLRV